MKIVSPGSLFFILETGLMGLKFHNSEWETFHNFCISIMISCVKISQKGKHSQGQVHPKI